MNYSATRVRYMYCDASNYKFFGAFVLSGQFALESISDTLDAGEFFVPERVGLPSLVPKCQNEDDHWLHTFLEAEPCSDEYGALCSTAEFLRRMKAAAAEGWFVLDDEGVQRPRR